jgi:hypothetical protein
MAWKAYEVELKERGKVIQASFQYSRDPEMPEKWSHPPAIKNEKKFAAMRETHAFVMHSNPKGGIWIACSKMGYKMQFQDGETVIIEMSSSNWSKGFPLAMKWINGDPKLQTREERNKWIQHADTVNTLVDRVDTLEEDNADLKDEAAKQQAAAAKQKAAFVMIVRFVRRKKAEKEAEQAAIINEMKVEASANEAKLFQALQVHNSSVL